MHETIAISNIFTVNLRLTTDIYIYTCHCDAINVHGYRRHDPCSGDCSSRPASFFSLHIPPPPPPPRTFQKMCDCIPCIHCAHEIYSYMACFYGLRKLPVTAPCLSPQFG